MAGGTLFLVVGASGVGKDTLIGAAKAALAGDNHFVFTRRTITRLADAGGEEHCAVTADEFARRRDAGRFLVAWSAHDLDYGLPIEIGQELANGRHVIANGSRAAIADAAERVAQLVIVEVTAPPDLVARRLAGRGRESDAQVAERLARATPPYPAGTEVVSVANDADVATGVARFVAALRLHSGPPFRLRAVPLDTWHERIAYLPANSTIVRAQDYLGPGRIDVIGAGRSTRARVHLIDDPRVIAADELGLSESAFTALGLPQGAPVRIERTPSPDSIDALRAKIRGDELDERRYRMLIRDIVEDRYADREVSAFLVAATRSLSDAEVLALTRVRTDFVPRLAWDEPIVADKHSLGGVPGSRITLLVVPIVAAHGLAVPKTSSRAITSAAGTADAMEALARVDLTVDDVRRVIAKARGCIAWNGRLNHSVVDDVMNAIVRPLGIDSNRWSVASILSKKLIAGATHVIVDLPCGPRAKLKSRAEADEIAALFAWAGRELGLVVEAHATDGSAPIGRGVGPALEVRDCLWILENNPQAPRDLRDKALFFAGRMLAWDPGIGSPEKGRARAEALLASGAARAALEGIIAAQGRTETICPGAYTQIVHAPHTGRVVEIDGWCIAGIARRAGAPMDKGAGIDLVARVNDEVRSGDPLYVIHAGSEADLAAAAATAAKMSGYVMEG
ncbi:MAG: phosphonate metabolism protein/1,5-bisphosphokinase (PRPP-forming) PhnN [Xanthobacteraceae bacterium]